MISSDVTGSRKFKTAAGKLEILIYRLLDELETRSQRLDPGFRGSITSVAPFRILSYVTGCRKFNMTANKPELIISRLPDEIETRS